MCKIQIVRKLSVQPPKRDVVIKRLKDIADEFGVDWDYEPDDEDMPCEGESSPAGMPMPPCCASLGDHSQ